MSKKEYDVCVIGAGPGGYVAAIRAAQMDMKTAVIEKGDVGGVCLNIGCIPTKTLISSAEVLHHARHAAEFGLKITGKVEPDWKAMQERKAGVVAKLRGGVGSLLKSAGVDVIKGEAKFVDRSTLKINGKETISAKNIIVATGSVPLVPGFIPKSGRVLTSTELLSIEKIPKSLMVLGGGVIGCEFACLFAELGAEVTVVELLDNILPVVDRETAKYVARKMKEAGIKVLTGDAMENIKATAKGVSATAGKEKLSAEYLLVSIGRASTTSELNLEAAGVKTDERGWIPVTSTCRTNVPGIFAIGDVTGKWQLAHAASAMGVTAVENIAGKRREFRSDLVPGCIFTRPEIGIIGLTAEECKEKGMDVTVGKFPFAALGKAMAINETDGYCKIITDSATDQIVGVHIVGPHATDLISEASPAMLMEATAKELGKAIHPHPTLGEIMMEAAHAVHGESAHIPAPRKRKK